MEEKPKDDNIERIKNLPPKELSAEFEKKIKEGENDSAKTRERYSEYYAISHGEGGIISPYFPNYEDLIVWKNSPEGQETMSKFVGMFEIKKINHPEF